MIGEAADFDAAQLIVKRMETVFPDVYEGLYGSFLKTCKDCDRSRWTGHLSHYLTQVNGEWAHVSRELALVLWERFQKRISC